MRTFADDVARSIAAAPQFHRDFGLLRSSGILTTLPRSFELEWEGEQAEIPEVPLDVLSRLMSSASVLALSNDEVARDLAQQIAIFSSQVTDSEIIVDGAVHVLAQLGNFPGLAKVAPQSDRSLTLQTFLRSRLLAEVNSVTVAGKKRALTDFQYGVWNELNGASSLGVSAPTSAGKSFVVLEHLRNAAQRSGRFVGIYVAPTRALIAEVQRTLEERIGDLDGTLRITTLPVPDSERRPRQIYVLTQERLQILLSSISLKEGVDLVVVDEAQAIAEGHRGMILQDALEKVNDRSLDARFVFLAPGADGFIEMSQAVGVPQVNVVATMLSPVVQNRIVVTVDPLVERRLKLTLLGHDGQEQEIGDYVGERGFAVTERQRLATVALELGRSGRSLVYATGPARAEEIARQIFLEQAASNAAPRQAARENLAKFIEKDIHKDYSLAKFVRHGVAFHYANMPSLLRESIEDAFREGHLNFLCCTTTLFQGVNLPARNVFIDTPERGRRGDLLDEAALWNFAGRAGRLGQDVVGNVFLINYRDWPTKPLSKRVPFELKVAFQETIVDEYSHVMEVLESARTNVRRAQQVSDRAKAAAGLSLYRSAEGSLETLLNRPGRRLPMENANKLRELAQQALEQLGLPKELLASNWGVEPIALGDMLTRLRKAVEKREFKKIIPIHPTSPDAYAAYTAIIFRMFKYFDGRSFVGKGNGFRGYVNRVTVVTLSWMRGLPLAALLREAVDYAVHKDPEERKRQAVVDAAIRDLFEMVEKTVRFQLVQWARAYVDLLRLALREGGYQQLATEVYDFALALELGISTKTGQSLMELGLSRITAASVAAIINNSAMNVEQVRSWLLERQEALKGELSQLVLGELQSRGLIDAPGGLF